MNRWLELADGVYARRYAELDLTVGLVVGDGECLVIDTRGDGEQGSELAAAVRLVTAEPWQVAITHAHFDHCFGTAAFLPAPVWAHRRCADDLAETGERQRAHWKRHYAPAQPHIARAIEQATLVPPDRVFDDRVELSVGGRDVVLAHLGHGHTDHDIVVWLPDAGVLFAGDLVENGAPPAFDDSFPAQWPATVDALLAFGATTVVPGHGDPVDAAFVQTQREELAAVAELCRRAGDATGDAALVAASPYPADVTRVALARAESLRRNDSENRS